MMVQGDYLDYEKIEREYDMVLDTFQCESGTGQTLSLDHAYYMYLKQNSNILCKSRLHPLVLKLNPPMETATEKRATKFLQMFKIETPMKGKVLTVEARAAEYGYIVLQGDLLKRKRLFEFPSVGGAARREEQLVLN